MEKLDNKLIGRLIQILLGILIVSQLVFAYEVSKILKYFDIFFSQGDTIEIANSKISPMIGISQPVFILLTILFIIFEIIMYVVLHNVVSKFRELDKRWKAE